MSDIQQERRLTLIKYLLSENPSFSSISIPKDEAGEKSLLRALVNVRLPSQIDEKILLLEDEYLQEENKRKGIVTIDDLSPKKGDIYLYQGDITRLKVDAIVNAANSGMTGCYYPNHHCIDNAIHTYAGMRLRLECAEIMRTQGHEEEVGLAKITKGYNLPASYVIHTVGPYIVSKPSKTDEEKLRGCYRNSLALADSYGLGSIAFCAISTGEFHYPKIEAAKVAISEAESYKKETGSRIKIIFDVFSDEDRRIYERLLGD